MKVHLVFITIALLCIGFSAHSNNIGFEQLTVEKAEIKNQISTERISVRSEKYQINFDVLTIDSKPLLHSPFVLINSLQGEHIQGTNVDDITRKVRLVEHILSFKFLRPTLDRQLFRDNLEWYWSDKETYLQSSTDTQKTIRNLSAWVKLLRTILIDLNLDIQGRGRLLACAHGQNNRKSRCPVQGNLDEYELLDEIFTELVPLLEEISHHPVFSHQVAFASSTFMGNYQFDAQEIKVTLLPAYLKTKSGENTFRQYSNRADDQNAITIVKNMADAQALLKKYPPKTKLGFIYFGNLFFDQNFIDTEPLNNFFFERHVYQTNLSQPQIFIY